MRLLLTLVLLIGIGIDILILVPQIQDKIARPSTELNLVGPGIVTLLFVILPWIALSRRASARTQVPVCYENDVPVGSPYILPSGDRHIVRVRQVEPPECEYLEDLDGDDSFMVAGISRYEHAVADLLRGQEISVSAIREPENKKDRDAIRVEATWVSSAGRRCKGTLGYIQATAAAAIARTYADSPLECMVDVIFAPRKGMNAGMRVHLLVHETAKRTRRRTLRKA